MCSVRKRNAFSVNADEPNIVLLSNRRARSTLRSSSTMTILLASLLLLISCLKSSAAADAILFVHTSAKDRDTRIEVEVDPSDAVHVRLHVNVCEGTGSIIHNPCTSCGDEYEVSHFEP